METPGTSNNQFEDLSPVENPWRIKHPVVTFFHLLFRTLALIAYLLCGWFSNNFIGSFVAIILLLSMDFWTVKNITGRIMAGLRWWNYVNDEGESVWMFESATSESNKFSRAEIQIFWGGLIAFPVVWVCLFFTALFTFKLKWMVLVVIGLVFTVSNLVGFLRCRMGNTMAGAANQYVQHQIKNNLLSMFRSNKTPSQPPQT